MEFGFEQHVPIQLKSHLGEKGIIALLSMSKKLGAQNTLSWHLHLDSSLKFSFPIWMEYFLSWDHQEMAKNCCHINAQGVDSLYHGMWEGVLFESLVYIVYIKERYCLF